MPDQKTITFSSGLFTEVGAAVGIFCIITFVFVGQLLFIALVYRTSGVFVKAAPLCGSW